MRERMECECGSVRWVGAGMLFPPHPDREEAELGRFQWCKHGDMSGVIVAVEACDCPCHDPGGVGSHVPSSCVCVGG